jgi:hypothetical protein
MTEATGRNRLLLFNKIGIAGGLFEFPSLLPGTAIRGTSFTPVGSIRSRSRLRWNMAPSRKSSKRSAPVVRSLDNVERTTPHCRPQ